MERIKIAKMSGTFYTLYDCHGEIETSQDLQHLKELYNIFSTDDELRNEMYGGADRGLRIEKETYDDNGRILNSEVIFE